MTHIGPPKSPGSYNFQLLKIQHGERTPFWKKDKRPHLGNNMTNWREIWHADAHWPSELYCHLKFRTFTTPKWQTADILENRKTSIFRQRLDWSALNMALYLQLQIWIPKNARWRTAAILIAVKLLYLRNVSTCRRENCSYDTCWPY